MDNLNEQIELYFNRGLYPYYCTFNLKNEFILCGKVYDKDEISKNNINMNDKNIDRYIWTYSTQTVNNKWMCKGIYKIPRGFELISISKYDKLYLLSDNYIHEWNILNRNMTRIIYANEGIEKREGNKEKEKKVEKGKQMK